MVRKKFVKIHFFFYSLFSLIFFSSSSFLLFSSFPFFFSFALGSRKGKKGKGGAKGEDIRTSDVAQRPLILWRREFGNPMVLTSRYRGPKFVAF